MKTHTKFSLLLIHALFLYSTNVSPSENIYNEEYILLKGLKIHEETPNDQASEDQQRIEQEQRAAAERQALVDQQRIEQEQRAAAERQALAEQQRIELEQRADVINKAQKKALAKQARLEKKQAKMLAKQKRIAEKKQRIADKKRKDFEKRQITKAKKKSNKFIAATPPLVIKNVNVSPKSLAAKKHDIELRNRAIISLKTYFIDNKYTLFNQDFDNINLEFANSEIKNLDDAIGLLNVSKSNLVSDMATKTIVVKSDKTNGKIYITEPIVKSGYEQPLQTELAIIHDPKFDISGEFTTSSHYLDDAEFTQIKTSYGSLIRVYGKIPVNNSFSAEVLFNDASGNAAIKQFYITPELDL